MGEKSKVSSPRSKVGGGRGRMDTEVSGLHPTAEPRERGTPFEDSEFAMLIRHPGSSINHRASSAPRLCASAVFLHVPFCDFTRGPQTNMGLGWNQALHRVAIVDLRSPICHLRSAICDSDAGGCNCSFPRRSRLSRVWPSHAVVRVPNPILPSTCP